MDYDDYEAECKKITEDNKKYLDLFESALTKKGLSDRTIQTHLSNADFYINNYLLHYDPIPMKEGCYKIDNFLGYYFIRKCMWSTPGSIKTTAASLKKFYLCMVDNKVIDRVDYIILCETIKDSIMDWQEDCRKFNDPSEENPFIIL